VHVASSHKSCGVEAEDEQVDVMDCIKLFYPKITVFCHTRPYGHFILLLRPINWTLWGWGSLILFHFHFVFPRIDIVSHELEFYSSNQMRERGR
jgi:hypothetical protein